MLELHPLLLFQLFMILDCLGNRSMRHKYHAQCQMNDLVDLFPLVGFLVNQGEVVVHQLEKVGFQVIQLVDSYLGIEDTLEAEEGQDEIVEDLILLLLQEGCRVLPLEATS